MVVVWKLFIETHFSKQTIHFAKKRKVKFVPFKHPKQIIIITIIIIIIAIVIIIITIIIIIINTVS